MHVHFLRGRSDRRAQVLWVAALLAVCVSNASVPAMGASTSQLAGPWSGTYSGAYSGTFKLHWTQSGSKLSGSIALSNPTGTHRIGGSVVGRAVKFGVVTVGVTYTGSVARDGKSMSGTYRSRSGGGTWRAHKTS